MTLLELLNMANKGYPGKWLSLYYNETTGKRFDEPNPNNGDTLAEFIVIELIDTFDPDASDDVQVDTAARALERACRDLEGVIDVLYFPHLAAP